MNRQFIISIKQLQTTADQSLLHYYYNQQHSISPINTLDSILASNEPTRIIALSTHLFFDLTYLYHYPALPLTQQHQLGRRQLDGGEGGCADKICWFSSIQ
jgi:hypothetical protein